MQTLQYRQEKVPGEENNGNETAQIKRVKWVPTGMNAASKYSERTMCTRTMYAPMFLHHNLLLITSTVLPRNVGGRKTSGYMSTPNAKGTIKNWDNGTP